MHKRTNIRLRAADRNKRETVVTNRNSPQKQAPFANNLPSGHRLVGTFITAQLHFRECEQIEIWLVTKIESIHAAGPVCPIPMSADAQIILGGSSAGSMRRSG
jgi:hypothetical protein